MINQPIKIAVLVSGHGRGTNLQAIIDACEAGKIDGEVAVVVGVRDDAPAMDRARSYNIPAIAISPKSFQSDEEYDSALLKVLKDHRVDLICLAGYMRVLAKALLTNTETES